MILVQISLDRGLELEYIGGKVVFELISYFVRAFQFGGVSNSSRCVQCTAGVLFF